MSEDVCEVCHRKKGHMNDERLGTCPRAAQISFSGKHDSLCFLIGYERATRALSSERLARVEAERERDEARSALRLFVTESWKPEADGHAEGCPRIGISLPGGGGCSVTCGKLRAALGAEPGDAGVRYAPMLSVDTEADARMNQLRASQPASQACPLAPTTKGEP